MSHKDAELRTRSWRGGLTTIEMFHRRKLITGLFVVCLLSLFNTPAFGTDYSKSSVSKLIDELTKIDSRSPGVDSAAIYEGFIADGTPGSVKEGVPGMAAPRVPPQMSELVRRGPLALRELIKHLDDKRPTKLEVGTMDTAGLSHQEGVNFIPFGRFGDEYDPRARDSTNKMGPHIWPPLEWKVLQGRYTVRVGDVCFVLIGQIVNRRLYAVRYVSIAGLVVNSPIEIPALAERVRNDWGQVDADQLRSSLLADIHADSFSQSDNFAICRTETIYPALQRLRLYFPDTYKALEGNDLKVMREFEKQEAEQQSSSQK